MAARNILYTTGMLLGEQGLEKAIAMAFAGFRKLKFGVALMAPAKSLGRT
jgi:hypothetical protein